MPIKTKFISLLTVGMVSVAAAAAPSVYVQSILPEPKEIMGPNVLGGHKMMSPGLLKFELKGKPYSLQSVHEDDGTLFLIFRDESNETTTYDAGRFLYAGKAVNGETVLDFKTAQNPPSAFTPYATCPLAPDGNTLPVAIAAGERRQ